MNIVDGALSSAFGWSSACSCWSNQRWVLLSEHSAMDVVGEAKVDVVVVALSSRFCCWSTQQIMLLLGHSAVGVVDVAFYWRSACCCWGFQQ